jgi:hypothetical protein
MGLDGYLFFSSLIGIIVVLSRKASVVRQYDRMNINDIHFDPAPKTRLIILSRVYILVDRTKEKIILPVKEKLVIITKRVGKKVVQKISYVKYRGRKLGTTIQKKGEGSAYIQKILEQKRKIQQESLQEEENQV